MKYRKQKRLIYILVALLLGMYSCRKIFVDHQFRETYSDVNEAINRDGTGDSYFKIHFKNGDVSLLENWGLNHTQDSIHGEGVQFDFNRDQLKEGKLQYDLEEIAIIETNQLNDIKGRDKERISTLSIVTGLNAVLGILCITNPKACFGSCPTFYIDGDTFIHEARAEGFSSSISPALEKKDIDALNFSTRAKSFEITMKNEALETHMVNELHLLAVPRAKNDNIFHDKYGNFYNCGPVLEFKTATPTDKNIIEKVGKLDQQEYFSTTDENDLAAKESLLFEWTPVQKSEYGVVLNFRQTLLTTFLLYSGISYMGDEVGDYFAKIESNEAYKKRLSNPFKKLGNIELSLWNSSKNSWESIESIFETGPIAKNLLLVPLKDDIKVGEPVRIKLEMSKGLWRMDYVGLTSIKNEVKPIELMPSTIETVHGAYYSNDYVNSDDEQYLVSFPGDEFNFSFEMPELKDQFSHELFLSVKGYYLEWIRQAWLDEKQPEKLKKMLLNDKATWVDLAREYKSMEYDMESVFWNSKYSNLQ